MPSSARIGCVNSSGNSQSSSFHQIQSNKPEVIRQEWFCCIKRGQNEKYLPKDSILYIYLEHSEIYEIHCKIDALLYTKFYTL